MEQSLCKRGIVFAIIIIVMCFSFPAAGFAEEDELQVVKLQLRWDNQFQFAGFYAADWQGYYAEEGIKVEIIPAIKSDQSVISSVEEVSEGRADFGIGSADILIANDRGADLRVVAVIMQRSAARYYLRKETNYTGPTDLMKLKVARNVNDLIDVELQAMLINEGIDPKLIKTYPHQAGMDHLISDKVQVLPGYKLGIPYTANQKGILIKEINPQDYGVDFYGDSLFVSGSFVDQNPEIVEKFKRASLKGWEYAFNHSEEIATKISNDLTNFQQYSDLLNFNLYQAQIMKDLAEYPIIDVGHINPYRWQKMGESLKKIGLIKKEVDVNKLIFDPVKLNTEKEKQRNDFLTKLGVGSIGLLILIGLWVHFLRRAIKRKTEEIAKAQSSLMESESKYKFLFEHSGLGVGFYSIDGTIISFNKKATENMGGSDEYEGKSLYDLFPKAEADFFVDRISKASKTDSPEDYIDFVSLKSGNKCFSSTVKRIKNHDGEVIGVQIISQDITERISAEKDLKASENRFREVLQNLEAGVVVHDVDSKIIDCNKRAAEMLGLSKQQLLGIDATNPRWVFVNEAGVQLPIEEYPVFMVLNSKKPIKDKIFGVYDPNTSITTWVNANGTLIYNQMGEIEEVVISFTDITERKKSEQIMINLSYYDQLTGLYNRRFYEEELKRLDKEINLPITLIILDVNGLKLTNDAFGHQAGDVLLKMITELLKNECRNDEIISRIGGDEFVILLPKTDSETAKKLIQRISIAVNKEQSHNALISLAIGYALKDSVLKQFDETFKEAEDNMYRHKLTESASFRSKSIDIIMNSLYEKSSREMNHSKRVSYLCEQIASKLGFNQEDIRECRVAGLVHDIGKMGVSNIILDKEGKLSNEEWAEMKKHSEMGYRILGSVIEFSAIAEFVLSHQERWDGKGYPQALKGEQIPIQSRIIAIADSFDAMTVERSYRKAMSETEAISEIKKCAGTQFDPKIARGFVEKVLGKTW